jgi:diamine N-acetyltransferase
VSTSPHPDGGPAIRLAAAEDALGWARFAARERARTYEAVMPTWFGPQAMAAAQESAPRLAAALAAPGERRYLLAEVDSEIVGVAEAGPAPAEWEVELGLLPSPAPQQLDLLYLRSDQHGTGLADRLLTAALVPGPVYLWLIDGNVRAERFYLRRGFRNLGESVSTGESWGNIPMHRMLRDGAAR